jgi:hypothetical protein
MFAPLTTMSSTLRTNANASGPEVETELKEKHNEADAYR